MQGCFDLIYRNIRRYRSKIIKLSLYFFILKLNRNLSYSLGGSMFYRFELDKYGS